MSGHLKRLCDIGYFTCPQVSELRPYSIPDRMEIIEILTGGKLRFEMNGEERIFGRGTVFWHMAGDKTICRTFIDDPYRCMVFRFIVGENRRPGPRVSSWQNPEETMTFCEECHRAFHSGGVDLEALGEYAYAMIRWKSQSHGDVPAENTPKALRDVCAYIERHLGEELSLDRMAARCGSEAIRLRRQWAGRNRRTNHRRGVRPSAEWLCGILRRARARRIRCRPALRDRQGRVRGVSRLPAGSA